MINEFKSFFKGVVSNRSLLIDLVKNDFKSRYLQNYLGVLWAFIQPTITILIFWFVFQVGFKSAPVENVPFILWLIGGMIPWFFFAESLQTSTNSILENSFLVKKIVFRVSLLPIVKITSALIVHVFFILILFFIFMLYGFSPDIYWLQIIYYLFSSLVLLIGLSWITSSVVIFFRDLGQIVSMSIQFLFWLTPIFWNEKMIPSQYHWVIEFNPVFYIIQGYRDALIGHVWFWTKLDMLLIFWGGTFVLLALGAFVFRRLRPHFADVL